MSLCESTLLVSMQEEWPSMAVFPPAGPFLLDDQSLLWHCPAYSSDEMAIIEQPPVPLLTVPEQPLQAVFSYCLWL